MCLMWWYDVSNSKCPHYTGHTVHCIYGPAANFPSKYPELETSSYNSIILSGNYYQHTKCLLHDKSMPKFSARFELSLIALMCRCYPNTKINCVTQSTHAQLMNKTVSLLRN
jgi:hypothetical protein